MVISLARCQAVEELLPSFAMRKGQFAVLCTQIVMIDKDLFCTCGDRHQRDETSRKPRLESRLESR